MLNLKSVLDALTNPATKVGTAWWATLTVTLYDAARHGLSFTNGGILLALAGVDIAARYFNQPPPMPPQVPA